jgi:hypothetical protein
MLDYAPFVALRIEQDLEECGGAAVDAADPFGTKGLCLLGSLWDV